MCQGIFWVKIFCNRAVCTLESVDSSFLLFDVRNRKLSPLHSLSLKESESLLRGKATPRKMDDPFEAMDHDDRGARDDDFSTRKSTKKMIRTRKGAHHRMRSLLSMLKNGSILTCGGSRKMILVRRV